MFDSISKFDKQTAAGLLARIALSLEDQGNPATDMVLDGEAALREAIVQEVRRKLGFVSDDNSPEALSRMADFLDDEADNLIGPLDEASALRRLAESGDLPTDLYEVAIPESQAYPKDFDLESDLIRTTIRYPLKEQHYGRAKSQNEPSLISLFARRFRTKWPYKDFVLLVVAAREGLLLTVHHAWRLYPSVLLMPNFASPLEMLEAFADKYGIEIIQGEKRGKLLLTTGSDASNRIKFDVPNPKHTNILVSFATQSIEPSKPASRALVIAIDIDKYKQMLEKMFVTRQEILDERFNAPMPRERGADA